MSRLPVRGALLALTTFVAACAAPGTEVTRQEGDFALIEIQLQG